MAKSTRKKIKKTINEKKGICALFMIVGGLIFHDLISIILNLLSEDRETYLHHSFTAIGVTLGAAFWFNKWSDNRLSWKEDLHTKLLLLAIGEVLWIVILGFILS